MSTKSDFKPRIAKIYDLDEFEKLIQGVAVASCMLTDQPAVVDEASVLKRVTALTLGGAPGGEKCSCCGAGPFESRAQQTAHYKHHWHAYNLKRRLFGKNPLTLQQFNSRQDDNSSVSGSDSETEEPSTKDSSTDLFVLATRHCKAFFTNKHGQAFCLYRCVLHHRKETISTDGEGHVWVQKCLELKKPGAMRWAVIMVSGGHFAGAIFAGGTAVLHKTLHSYVTRRGQGQAQGTRDQHGSAPRSAGASLRRYNQAQFAQHVQDIINSWADDLAGCSLVLYRAVGPLNQAVLFGKNSPLAKEDLRLRMLPFPTRKPSFKEVQRVFATVASIEVYDTLEQFQKALLASTVRTTKPASDSGSERPARKTKQSPGRPIDRAKSREPIVRELPIQVTSSEDEGPCYIDSETPVGWIKTLSEQTSHGVISSSRRDLLNDHMLESRSTSESEMDKNQDDKPKKKSKKPKKPEEKVPKKVPSKIPTNVKKMWKVISSGDNVSLDAIIEQWEGEVAVSEACNTADPSDGNTALHKAAIVANPSMVTQILSLGGDPCVKNHRLQTPYAASNHGDTRIAFRLFQGQHPDMYNYAKSQIPGALTPESVEAEKEKKAQQKKAKRQRDKEKQIEKIKSGKFLDLTDEQKIKLSKEERRCFLCGAKLPKVPFEYEQYQFCGVECLKSHRKLRPLKMTA